MRGRGTFSFGVLSGWCPSALTSPTAGRLRAVRRLFGVDTLVIGQYGYDANGNRTASTDPSGLPNAVTASYDAQDRLTAYGNATYSYGRNGELTKRTFPQDTTLYTYDELGNLLRVVKQGGTTLTYLIDGENRRVGKKRNGTLERVWLYQNGLNVVAELDGSGTLKSRFVYGSRSNVPDYMVTVDSTYRLITDQLGSVRRVVNVVSGSTRQRLEYDAWGNVLTDTNEGFQPFGFAGGLYDPDTKLVRFGAREYDASVGRWTCKDPIGLAGGSLNLMAYAGSDPLNGSDPRGTDYWLEGPSGPDEPRGHVSICVGNPNGEYRCYSFGADGKLRLDGPEGQVYEDEDKPGNILPGSYRQTRSSDEDKAIENWLSSFLGEKGRYGLGGNLCSDWSRSRYGELVGQGLGMPSQEMPRPFNPDLKSFEPPFPSMTRRSP